MLWIDFLNSDARDHLGRGQHQDRLEDPQWIKDFVTKWDLPPVQVRSRPQYERISQLRSMLRRWVTAIVNRQPIPETDVKALNRQLNAYQIRPKLTKRDGEFRLDLVPSAKGLDALMFAVAASFAQFLVDGDSTRLKTCDNDDCVWVFYDTTRSRTRRWCATGCGDLIKVREFRQRQKRKAAAQKNATSKRKNRPSTA